MNLRFMTLVHLFGVEGFRARHQMLYLLAPIWKWCMDKTHGVSKQLTDRGLRLLLESTSTIDAFLLHGYSAQRPATVPTHVDNPDWFEYFISIGGLPTLVSGLVGQSHINGSANIHCQHS
jgi:hypothetical protein